MRKFEKAYSGLPKKRQGIAWWRQFACCTLSNWTRVTRSLKIAGVVLAHQSKTAPTAAIPLGKWLAPGEVPLLRGQDAAQGIHGLCRTWGVASYRARSGGRGHVTWDLLFLLFAGIPCISHAFRAADTALGIFVPIQAASRREARKRLDESLSWVGVEWVRVTGWWLIGTQFWWSKPETPQPSPAVLFANLVSIASVSGMASTQSNGKYLKTSSLGCRTSKPAAEPVTKFGTWQSLVYLGTKPAATTVWNQPAQKSQNIEIRLTMTYTIQWLNLKKLVFRKGNGTRTYFYEARIARIDEEGLDLKPSKAKTAKNKEAGWLLASRIYMDLWILGSRVIKIVFTLGWRFQSVLSETPWNTFPCHDSISFSCSAHIAFFFIVKYTFGRTVLVSSLREVVDFSLLPSKWSYLPNGWTLNL